MQPAWRTLYDYAASALPRPGAGFADLQVILANADRVKAMEAANVIRGSTIDISYSHLGYIMTAIVGMRIQGGHLGEIEGRISEEDVKEHARRILSSVGTFLVLRVVATTPRRPWSIRGPVTSPFCERRSWEACHPGIDIAVPTGTPIRAVKDGSIVLVQSEAASGGYGNFTCIDHGGGLSSCYAHQSSFARTSGSISQGDILGYVGCTGHCFGDHLHFEVRVNGSPVDPMGYL